MLGRIFSHPAKNKSYHDILPQAELARNLAGFFSRACGISGLVVGIFAFWGTLFVGSEIGYQKWQSIPNPPDEAFADTFPMGALLAGWLPGSVYCGFLFGIMRLCLLLIPKRNSINAPTPSSTVRTESGNPYQGP